MHPSRNKNHDIHYNDASLTTPSALEATAAELVVNSTRKPRYAAPNVNSSRYTPTPLNATQVQPSASLSPVAIAGAASAVSASLPPHRRTSISSAHSSSAPVTRAASVSDAGSGGGTKRQQLLSALRSEPALPGHRLPDNDDDDGDATGVMSSSGGTINHGYLPDRIAAPLQRHGGLIERLRDESSASLAIANVVASSSSNGSSRTLTRHQFELLRGVKQQQYAESELARVQSLRATSSSVSSSRRPSTSAPPANVPSAAAVVSAAGSVFGAVPHQRRPSVVGSFSGASVHSTGYAANSGRPGLASSRRGSLTIGAAASFAVGEQLPSSLLPPTSVLRHSTAHASVQLTHSTYALLDQYDVGPSVSQVCSPRDDGDDDDAAGASGNSAGGATLMDSSKFLGYNATTAILNAYAAAADDVAGANDEDEEDDDAGSAVSSSASSAASAATQSMSLGRFLKQQNKIIQHRRASRENLSNAILATAAQQAQLQTHHLVRRASLTILDANSAVAASAAAAFAAGAALAASRQSSSSTASDAASVYGITVTPRDLTDLQFSATAGSMTAGVKPTASPSSGAAVVPSFSKAAMRRASAVSEAAVSSAIEATAAAAGAAAVFHNGANISDAAAPAVVLPSAASASAAAVAAAAAAASYRGTSARTIKASDFLLSAAAAAAAGVNVGISRRASLSTSASTNVTAQPGSAPPSQPRVDAAAHSIASGSTTVAPAGTPATAAAAASASYSSIAEAASRAARAQSDRWSMPTASSTSPAQVSASSSPLQSVAPVSQSTNCGYGTSSSGALRSTVSLIPLNDVADAPASSAMLDHFGSSSGNDACFDVNVSRTSISVSVRGRTRARSSSAFTHTSISGNAANTSTNNTSPSRALDRTTATALSASPASHTTHTALAAMAFVRDGMRMRSVSALRSGSNSRSSSRLRGATANDAGAGDGSPSASAAAAAAVSVSVARTSYRYSDAGSSSSTSVAAASAASTTSAPPPPPIQSSVPHAAHSVHVAAPLASRQQQPASIAAVAQPSLAGAAPPHSHSRHVIATTDVAAATVPLYHDVQNPAQHALSIGTASVPARPSSRSSSSAAAIAASAAVPAPSSFSTSVFRSFIATGQRRGSRDEAMLSVQSHRGKGADALMTTVSIANEKSSDRNSNAAALHYLQNRPGTPSLGGADVHAATSRSASTAAANAFNTTTSTNATTSAFSSTAPMRMTRPPTSVSLPRPDLAPQPLWQAQLVSDAVSMTSKRRGSSSSSVSGAGAAAGTGGENGHGTGGAHVFRVTAGAASGGVGDEAVPAAPSADAADQAALSSVAPSPARVPESAEQQPSDATLAQLRQSLAAYRSTAQSNGKPLAAAQPTSSPTAPSSASGWPESGSTQGQPQPHAPTGATTTAAGVDSDVVGEAGDGPGAAAAAAATSAAPQLDAPPAASSSARSRSNSRGASSSSSSSIPRKVSFAVPDEDGDDEDEGGEDGDAEAHAGDGDNRHAPTRAIDANTDACPSTQAASTRYQHPPTPFRPSPSVASVFELAFARAGVAMPQSMADVLRSKAHDAAVGVDGAGDHVADGAANSAARAAFAVTTDATASVDRQRLLPQPLLDDAPPAGSTGGPRQALITSFMKPRAQVHQQQQSIHGSASTQTADAEAMTGDAAGDSASSSSASLSLLTETIASLLQTVRGVAAAHATTLHSAGIDASTTGSSTPPSAAFSSPAAKPASGAATPASSSSSRAHGVRPLVLSFSHRSASTPGLASSGGTPGRSMVLMVDDDAVAAGRDADAHAGGSAGAVAHADGAQAAASPLTSSIWLHEPASSSGANTTAGAGAGRGIRMVRVGGDATAADGGAAAATAHAASSSPSLDSRPSPPATAAVTAPVTANVHEGIAAALRLLPSLPLVLSAPSSSPSLLGTAASDDRRVPLFSAQAAADGDSGNVLGASAGNRSSIASTSRFIINSSSGSGTSRGAERLFGPLPNAEHLYV